MLFSARLLSSLLFCSLASLAMAQNQNEIKHYLELKDALIASDAEASQKAALSFHSALSAAHSDELRQELMDLSSSRDIEEQREHFEKISKVFYKELQGSKEPLGLYKQYCPMAFKGQGAFWLSDDQEIANPYFGDRMLRCGSVQEEL